MGFSITKLILLAVLTSIAATLLILPLVLRFSTFGETQVLIEYQDMIPIRRRVSTLWCENHTVHMDTASFSAYLMERESYLTEQTVQARRVHVAARSFHYVSFYFLQSSRFLITSCPLRPCRVYLVRGLAKLRACLRFIQGLPRRSKPPWNASHPIPPREGPASALPNRSKSCAAEAFVDIQTKCSRDEAISHDVLVEDYYFVLYVNNPFGHAYYNDVQLELSAWRKVFNRNMSLATCLEVHDCTLPLEFGSSQFVVVERPRRSVIHGEATLLTSRCNPRRKIYFLFHIAFAVLFIIIAFQ
ncbi:uncharacterized protein LOC135366668 isoform X1 [Ornithodoros turicata]|uniref:uncharacterized protein LOC135366668 isoform X1 n=1 Tax=Ornithodoros turicata TaxID=34597 RepID=UPI003138C361